MSNLIASVPMKVSRIFEETSKDFRTNIVLKVVEISDDEVIKKNSDNYDLVSWVKSAREGTSFSLRSKGLYYIRIR